MSSKSSFHFTVETPTSGRRFSSISELSLEELSDLDSEDGSEGLPLARIRFDGMTGRSDEIAQLKGCFDRIRAKKKGTKKSMEQLEAGDHTTSTPAAGSSEVVFLQGESGSGKTSLVDSALREYSSCHGGYYCYGKFDQILTHVPFSAIVQAFADLIDLISAEGDAAQAKEEILKVLSEEDVEILSKLTSNISYIIGIKQRRGLTTQDLLDELRLNHDVSVVRIKLIFTALLRALSSTKHPVVLVLDDLQWCDLASREVIRALLSDLHSKHVLIVCLHRKGDFKEIEEERVLHKTDISVANLNLFHLNEMIASLLMMETSTCMELSDLVMSKTLGNPYHSIQFLELLIRSNKMAKDNTTGAWTWDLYKISGAMNVSDNVAALLERKIKDLPRRLQLILQVAAHLGFRFEFDLLETLMFETLDQQYKQTIQIDDDAGADQFRQLHREKTERKLQNAVKEGLIETSGENKYKFSHDRIQEAIRDMVPAGKERQTLQVKLGSQLYKMAKASGDQEMLLLAADQLNNGQSQLKGAAQRVRLAKLNQQASNISLSKASLVMAREYLKKGISSFSSEILWEEHYPIALDLYSSLAELGDTARDVGQSKEAANNVLRHAKSNLDKMRAHHSIIESLISSSRFDEALQNGHDVLTSLGQKFSKKPGKIAVLYELVKVKRIIRGMSDKSFLALPVTHDETNIQTVRILQSMASAGYFSGVEHKFAYALTTLRNLRLSCEKGLCDYSVDGFSGYAIMLSMMGSYDMANRFGKLAVEISRKLKAKKMEARSSSGLYHLVFPWKIPLTDCIAGFQFSFRQGMATAETNIAFAAGVGAITLMHHTGSPLWETDQRMRLIVAQMKQYRQSEIARNALPFYQVVLNLKDISDYPSDLSGDAMDIAIGLSGYTINRDHAFKMECAASVTLAYYFEDWFKLEYLLPQYDGKFQPVKAHFSYFLSTFCAGMAYFELWRLRKSRAYKKGAEKKLRRMQQWLKGGNLNCLPLVLILQAEALSLSSSARVQDVLDLYDKGAFEACVLSFVQVEATAYERAACFLDGRESRVYLTKSFKLYHNWGADAKVKFLEKKHMIRIEDLVGESRQTLASSMSSAFSANATEQSPSDMLIIVE